MNAIIEKIKGGINKLPFNALASKVSALAKVAPYANYAFCALVLVVGVTVIANASGSSGDNPNKVVSLYLKDLETRVAKLEQAAEAKDGTAYEEASAEIADLRKDERFASLPADDAFPEKKKAELDALTSRVAKAEENVPANSESDFEIRLTDDGSGIIIANYKGTRKNVIIPATIQGLPVVEIGNNGANYSVSGTFELGKHGNEYDNRDLQSVTIPAGVKRIGERAFYRCVNLKSVSIPEGVEFIGKSAFFCCENLESVTFPSSLKVIYESAFWGAGITEAILPEGLAFLGNNAFRACDNLKTISLPKSLKWSREGYDFNFAKGCDNLENIIIPEGLEVKVALESDDFSFEKLFTGQKIKESVALQKLLKSYTAKGFYDNDYRTYSEFRNFAKNYWDWNL